MQVSIGFEIETQHFSPIQEIRPFVLFNPDYFYKANMSRHVYIYPDEFTSFTPFAKNDVEPYLSRQGKDTTKAEISLDNEAVFHIKSPLSQTFKNAEFVVTYTDFQVVRNIVDYMYQMLRQAIQDTEKVLSTCTTLGKITTRDFPYHYMWRCPSLSQPMVLLSKTDEWRTAPFAVQCTFGIPVISAMDVFVALSEEYVKVTGKDQYHAQILDIQKKTLDLFGDESPIIKNYMFLFMYSYKTRHRRKTSALFNVRHLFRDIWKFCFPKEKRDALFQHVQNVSSMTSPEFVTYFQDVHFQNTTQQKRLYQDMEKVGILPFKKDKQVFFFEFRGLSNITKHKCTRRTLENLALVH